MLTLRVPRLRQGSCFPGFLVARKTSEQAPVAVIQEAWIGGVPTRRVDELVQAMGLNGASESTVSTLETESHARGLHRDVARMVFTDPPCNVPVPGHVRSGNGGAHREFAMASGEMSDSEFRGFLDTFPAQAVGTLPAGGIADVCTDWRHAR